MNQVIINLRSEAVEDNNRRAIFCQSVKEIGVDKIQALGKDYQHFLITFVDEDNKVTSTEIDWEFCLFYATTFQYYKLFFNFRPTGSKIKKFKQ